MTNEEIEREVIGLILAVEQDGFHPDLLEVAIRHCIREARISAYEEAAKIADLWITDGADTPTARMRTAVAGSIAQEIRSLKESLDAVAA